MNYQETINWLLEGDVSIQYQCHLDLLGKKRKDLQKRIPKEGWGARLLALQEPDGNWGTKFYFPKWTCTHYTLLDLKNLEIPSSIKEISNSVEAIAINEKANDGGILPIGKEGLSDLCIDGMFLNYASYFRLKEHYLKSVVDCILSNRMHDGGFNCMSNRHKVVHSSLHTTISVLEGIVEYEKNGYKYRLDELREAQKAALEFILIHRLFLSDRTGLIIKKTFLKMTYPTRWYYDIFRALDCFQRGNIPWDDRMSEAIDVLLKKRNKSHTWNMQSKHPGQIHFEMEKAGKPGRWNTLRALRILKHFQIDAEQL